MVKYIFVTGGVVSSLGKGTTAASLGRLLKGYGFKVAIQKFDPYLNLNPGVMSPYQHGEVFVTGDGAETGMDLGHYERFVDIDLSGDNNVSAGKIYWEVLNRERRGEYQGGTVQVIPHITNEIKASLRRAEKNSDYDIIITEIGGTVGDIESQPFLEAARQLKTDLGKDNVLYIHVTLVPFLKSAGEAKTKPTQHSVKELRSLGIQPNIIVCRSEKRLSKEMTEKIALFCDIDRESVIQARDVSSIYDIPPMMQREGLDKITIKLLKLPDSSAQADNWADFYRKSAASLKDLNILLVGKYAELRDAYLSISEAIRHAAINQYCRPNIIWCCSTDLNKENLPHYFADADALIVPGGFGERGTEGKLLAASFARENNIPFLGIGLGMQMALIAFARERAGMPQAQSQEFDYKTPCPLICGLPGRKEHLPEMKSGAGECLLTPGSLVWHIYNKAEKITERYRHRYGINPAYKELLAGHGLLISGFSAASGLGEIIELKGHPYYLGCQFHPEFISRPHRPHPLFSAWIRAAAERKS